MANSAGNFATLAAIRHASSLVSIFGVNLRPGDWKWLKAGIDVGPTRVLQGRALAAVVVTTPSAALLFTSPISTGIT